MTQLSFLYWRILVLIHTGTVEKSLPAVNTGLNPSCSVYLNAPGVLTRQRVSVVRCVGSAGSGEREVLVLLRCVT